MWTTNNNRDKDSFKVTPADLQQELIVPLYITKL